MSGDGDVICPVCNAPGLTVRSMLYSVPYFNELAMFTIRCSKCGFSHDDIFSTEERPPSRWTLRVTSPEMLNIRVVRSSSGTIRFPDFGIDIEPGPGAESFISNVEGLLYRTRPVVESALQFAETEDQQARARELLTLIDAAIDGRLSFTVVIEDPMGVSGILPEDMTLVRHEELSREEASRLRGAPVWLDAVRTTYKIDINGLHEE
ncbi:MAG: ZPR1 zinc finger domain-containing protein [Candidatus Thorarchaeota archaeon]|nr:ZPR1 zinc finger domain-containing protein [Candidatus Thorarchaeota archaeon]